MICEAYEGSYGQSLVVRCAFPEQHVEAKQGGHEYDVVDVRHVSAEVYDHGYQHESCYGQYDFRVPFHHEFVFVMWQRYIL